MTNAELIKALRCCASPDMACKGLCPYHGVEYCLSKKDLDAADALEAADKRIAEQQKQIAQLYILLNNRINEVAELEAQLPKEGEWIPNSPFTGNCSECGGDGNLKDKYCPNCGAKMDGERKEKEND